MQQNSFNQFNMMMRAPGAGEEQKSSNYPGAASFTTNGDQRGQFGGTKIPLTYKPPVVGPMQKRDQAPHYRDFKVIGNGAFGYVFKAVESATGTPVAIKRSQKVGNKVSREFEVLTALKGKPNIIQLVDFFYSVDTKERLIQNSVFEFCDMSLEEVIKDLDRKLPSIYMPMAEIKRYTKEILNGLSHMHTQRIVHRDLKPENILIKKGQVKICDFGSSKFLDESPAHKNTPYVVSRYYRAPELIFASNKYNEAIDIWAVGCILFELITKTPLFPGDTEGLQILEQACILGSPTEEDLHKLSQIVEERVLNIVRKAMQLPRMDLRLLFNKGKYSGEDIEMAADLVHRMLRWVPSDRVSAQEAMNHPFLEGTVINI